jgi:O-antigen/teichoic acid export membrane protein
VKDLRSKTLTGLFWTIASQAGQQVLSFAFTVVLARLLGPADFGLVGKVVVFIGFARLIGDFGFGAALIHDQAADQDKVSSVFWVNLTIGMTLNALLWFGAPAVAAFYDDEALVPLLRLLSFGVTLAALTAVHRSTLRKALNFRAIAVADNAGALLSGLVAVALAVWGFGPRAIVWQSLAASAVSSLLLWRGSGFRPSLRFTPSAIRELWGYSSNLLGGSILNYWIRNLDNLLVGKFLGSAALGIYQRAYSTMLLPLNQVTQVTGQVMFPTMSLVQLDHARVKRIYLRALGAIALLSAPTMLGLLVTAEPFVLTVFGQPWRAVIPVLEVLSLVGLAQSLNATVGWLYNSQGRTDLQFRFVLVGGVLTYLAFGIGLRWGLVGIATAYAIRVYATTYFNYLIPGKLIGMRVREVGAAVGGPIACATMMAVIVFGLDRALLQERFTAPLRLGALSVVGAVVYVTGLRLFRVAALQDVLGILREKMAKRGSS